MNEIKNNRQKNLDIAFNSNLTNSIMIYHLLEKDFFANDLFKLNNLTHISNKKKMLIKENFTINKQYIKILDHFINMFSNDFYFIGKQKNIILETILTYNDYNDVFFATYNIRDNKYIDYFKIEMQKKMVYGFYKNLISLFNQSKVIKTFFESKNINANIDLNNKEDVSVLYQVLKQLSLTSTHYWEIIYLFEEIDVYIKNLSNDMTLNCNTTLQITTNFYILQWERMIDNYYKNEKIANFLLLDK